MNTEPAPDDKWALYSAALNGPRHGYYLARFKRFENDRWPWLSLNWAAMLCTFCWLRYRKMYAASWAYFFVSVPAILFFTFVFVTGADKCAAALVDETVFVDKLPFAMMLINFLLPLCANRLYFRFITKRVDAAKKEQPDRQAIEKKLRESGTVGGYLGASVLLIGLTVFVLLAAPNYSSYGTRAKISEVILAGSHYKTAATEFFEQHRQVPKSIDDIGGFSGPSGKVRRITLENDGSIRVTADFPPVDGRSVIFTPSVQDAKIVWVCRSGDIPAQCLPAMCKQK